MIKVVLSKFFRKELKQLAKKYRSITQDVLNLIDELEENPQLGTPLGNNFYKIRLNISDKNQGKSGGARVITLVKIIEGKLFLMSVSDKSEKDYLSEKELKSLLKNLEF